MVDSQWASERSVRGQLARAREATIRFVAADDGVWT
jgi:hypothetical protein